MLRQNELFDKRYRLLRLIGRGGFSEIWLAADEQTHTQVALKAYAQMDDDGVKMFSEEYRVIFSMNSQYLLRPLHFAVCENMPYLILPYCEQGSVSKYIGRLSEKDLWKLLHDVSSGLAYMHKKELVHQDIKPENILVDDDGDFLITDFGISTKIRSTLRKSTNSIAKDSAGTIAYMAPERFSANNRAVKASDIWSLGAMMYELMTEEPPFGDNGGLLQKNGADTPNINVSEYSDNLKNVVMRCLAKEPWDRPTAEQLCNGKIPESRPSSDRATQRNNRQDTSRGDNGYSNRDSEKSKGKKSFLWVALLSIVVVAGVVFYFKNYNPPTVVVEPIPPIQPVVDEEKNMFNDCKTVSDYQAYLKKYPNGKYASKAKENISAIDDTSKGQAEDDAAETRYFNACITVTGYRKYLERYPNGKYASQAKNKINELEQQRIQEEQAEDDAAETRYFNACFTIDGYRKYLERYPNGKYASQAQNKINELEQQRIQEEQARLQKTESQTYRYSKYKTLYRFRDTNGKYGYKNAEGKVMIASVYEQAEDFVNGRALVSLYGEKLYIDENGSRITTTNTKVSSKSSYLYITNIIDNPVISPVLREKPNVLSSVVYTCPKRSKVRVIEKSNKSFYKVSVEGHIGYIAVGFLKSK